MYSLNLIVLKEFNQNVHNLMDFFKHNCIFIVKQEINSKENVKTKRFK